MDASENRTIDITKIKNPKERAVLLLIGQKKQYRYGELIKSLNLSYRNGQELVYSLVSRGYVEFVGRSSELRLTGRIENVS